MGAHLYGYCVFCEEENFLKKEYNYFFNEIFSFVMKYLNIKYKDISLIISEKTWERCNRAIVGKNDQVGKNAVAGLVNDKENKEFRIYLENYLKENPIVINDFFSKILNIVRKWDIDEELFQIEIENVSTIIGVLRQAINHREVHLKCNTYEFESAIYTLTYKKDGMVELSCNCYIKVNKPISAISFATTAVHPLLYSTEQGQKAVLSEPRGGKKELIVMLEREYMAGETLKSGYKINMSADDDYSLHYTVETPIKHLILVVKCENYQVFPNQKVPKKYLTYSLPLDHDEPEASKIDFPLNGNLTYSPRNPKLGYQYVIQWYFD